MRDLMQFPVWSFILILGYPVLALAVLELARHLAVRAPFVSGILRQVAYVLLPAGALWLILRVMAELPADDWAVRTAETVFALTGLYLLLRVAQAALMGLMGEEQMRAPKLLLDILRIALSLVCGSVVVSSIWNIDLGRLLAAMGVGSILLAFALQQFLGNLLSGLGLLSAHKFSIGDWIIVEGKVAKVVEMDWHTVTLLTAGGERVVVANSTLAKNNLTIAARAGEHASATVPLTLGVDIPPEQVRDAVIEAGQAVPNLEPGGVSCVVTGIGDGTIKYEVSLSVANPGILAGPRDEFLSRFWYVAQRRGLRLDPVPTPDAAARLHMLEKTGAFRRDPNILPQLASASAFHRYRRGDFLLAAGTPATDAFFVVAGRLAVMVPTGQGEIRLELVAAGQLIVLQEMLAGGSSPVQVVADQDADVLAIPAHALLDAMDHSRVLARDISSVAEARRQAILPLNRGLPHRRLTLPASVRSNGNAA
jgi:small-conductance mechanosensitive channel